MPWAMLLQEPRMWQHSGWAEHASEGCCPEPRPSRRPVLAGTCPGDPKIIQCNGHSLLLYVLASYRG